MGAFTGSGDLQGAEFVDADLHGARFVRADLSGVVMRAVDVQGTDIDAPWLFDGESFLRVNGVDVIPFVDELGDTRKNPWNPDRQETTLSCLHVILKEEWDHHRYAVRDLEAIEAKSGE
jgi:pentapeptide repeat protein